MLVLMLKIILNIYKLLLLRLNNLNGGNYKIVIEINKKILEDILV